MKAEEIMAEVLATIADKYGVLDISKALRCLLDYAAIDADWAKISA
jgi:hypothetical protein